MVIQSSLLTSMNQMAAAWWLNYVKLPTIHMLALSRVKKANKRKLATSFLLLVSNKVGTYNCCTDAIHKIELLYQIIRTVNMARFNLFKDTK